MCPDQHEYTTTVGYFVNSVAIITTPTDPQANVAIDDGSEAIDGSVALALVEGMNTFEIEVTNGSAQQTYTLDITRRSSDSVTQTARIRPVSTPRSYIGTFMAASGDIVVIGAPEDDGNARGVNSIPIDQTLTNSGAAYVYVRDASGNWTQTAYLKASNADVGDEFGRAVAVSGGTVVVGARGEFDSETDTVSGAAYVFVRSQNGEWQQQAYLKPSASYTWGFGYALDIDGPRIAVGAPGYLNDRGAVFVFARNPNDDWAQEAMITASEMQDLAFSQELSLSGDTLAVGAHYRNENQGAVFMFRRSADDVWSEEAILEGSNSEPWDIFGLEITVEGDTMAVGAPCESSAATGVNSEEDDNSALCSGAVYIFTRTDLGDWEQRAYLKASNTQAEDLFGGHIALNSGRLAIAAISEDSGSGGINGDEADNNELWSGAVYLFAADASGNWSQRLYMKSSDPRFADRLGQGLALTDWGVVAGAPGSGYTPRQRDGLRIRIENR